MLDTQTDENEDIAYPTRRISLTDDEVDALLSQLSAPEDATSGNTTQAPTESDVPVATEGNRPRYNADMYAGPMKLSPKNVFPGQSDHEIAELLKLWKQSNRRKTDAAWRCYAGALGATRPTRDEQEEAHAIWYGSCTPLQIKILNAASSLKTEKRLARQSEERRQEYAKKKFDETGEPVRSYVTGRSDAEKAKRDAEKAKRYRERKKLAAAVAPLEFNPVLEELLKGL